MAIDYEQWYAEKCKNFDRHTSDDTFTPPEVMRQITEKVCAFFHIPEDNIVRPFYPGGDYQHFDYPEGCVVLDNPPFSLIKEIIKFYIDNDIKFFIFAPRTYFSKIPKEYINRVSIYGWDNIRYDNGVEVRTFYITNLATGYIKEHPYWIVGNERKIRKKVECPPKIFRDCIDHKKSLSIPISDITAYRIGKRYGFFGEAVELKHPVEFYEI